MRIEDIECLIIDYKDKLTTRELSFITDMIDFLKNTYIETEDVDGNIVKGEKTSARKLNNIYKQLLYLLYDNRAVVLKNTNKSES